MDDKGLHLPLEVLELIVDDLATNLNGDDDPWAHYRTALLNCALVCRALYARASSHLFSNVQITTKGERKDYARLLDRLDDLYEIMTENQALSSGIKSLTVETYTGSSRMDLLLYNSCLPLIFSQLSSIVSFAWINDDMPFPWALFGPAFVEGFKNLTRNPSLTSMKFSNIRDFDVDFLLRNGSLRHLELVHVDPLTQVIGETVSITSSLRSHVNHNAPRVTFGLLSASPMFFSQLRDLRVWMRNPDEVRAAWAIMESASQTLETLDIDGLSHFQYPSLIPGPVDIGVLGALRHFKLRCTIASGDGVIFPMGIYGLLTPRTSPSSVENVEITIDWVDCQIGTENMRFVDEPGWTALDKALSGSITFPDLRRVSLTLRSGYGWARQSAALGPPQRIVAVKDNVQALASRLLSSSSRRSMVKVGINVLIYKSRYAIDLD